MNLDIQRFACLLEELETSHKLICAGFGSLQEIDMTNDFYHLPHLLMASGLERLMKCYISLVHHDRNGTFPNMNLMRQLGHDLVALKNKICEKYYGGLARPLVKQELDFLTSDRSLQECIRILSLFGMHGRYYNLNIVAGSLDNPINPMDEWEELERSIEDPTPYLKDMEELHRNYYPRVHAALIAKLERMVRAIALQFTIGDHPDRFGKLKQTSVVFSDFRHLQDDQLGTTDYRRSVHILKQKQKNWIKRSENEIINGRWPTQVVTKDGFPGEWPFRVDRVVIELQEQLFAIVNIDGYAFALNGSAASRFNLPYPHDAGMAVFGKSVSPFTELALSMREVMK